VGAGTVAFQKKKKTTAKNAARQRKENFMQLALRLEN
jgi:hypothetical protein